MIVIAAYPLADLLQVRPELAEVSIAASVRDRLGESA